MKTETLKVKAWLKAKKYQEKKELAYHNWVKKIQDIHKNQQSSIFYTGESGFVVIK